MFPSYYVSSATPVSESIRIVVIGVIGPLVVVYDAYVFECILLLELTKRQLIVVVHYHSLLSSFFFYLLASITCLCCLCVVVNLFLVNYYLLLSLLSILHFYFSSSYLFFLMKHYLRFYYNNTNIYLSAKAIYDRGQQPPVWQKLLYVSYRRDESTIRWD